MTRALGAPRWQTPLPSTVVGSWGPDVAAFAQRELGIRLDRWQRRALNRALAYDARGILVHRHYLVSTGRQNGKTVIVRALIGWALTARATPAWTTMLGLAHDKKQARLPYNAILADLAPMARRLGSPARGGLALTRYLGIRSGMYGRPRTYDIGSREARDAIRGESVDLGLFDEIRTQRDHDTWAALEPTTRARPDPQIFGISTAGDDRSVLLREWWERGLRIIDGAERFAGFGMTWYAAGDDQAPDDPAAIRAANPAVAEGRVKIGPVAGSILTLSPAAYRSETLNLWSEGADEWLPPGTWPRRAGTQPAEAIRIVFGVEAASSWRRATVAVAAVTDAGSWIGVAGELDASTDTVGPADLVQLIARLVRVWHPAEVAYSAAWSGAPYIEAWAGEAGVIATPLGPRQIRSASQLLRSELIGARLTHADDPLLAQQVRVARPSGPLEGGDWYFSVRDSLGEIDALRAAAWAHWAAIAPEDAPAPPNIHV
jgi:hypothetical protein